MQRFREIGRSAGKTTRKASKKAADATTSAAGKAVDTTTSAAGKAASATTAAADATASAAGSTLKGAAAAPGAAFNAVFPECPVPTFMLPTGPGVEDYIFVFDLEEMLENLRSGVFVRPKIEVWAGREADYDADHFTSELEQDFVRQFQEAQESLTEAFRPHIEQLESRERLLSKEIRKEATGATLSSAANWTALSILLTPAGALLLIGLGIRPRLKLFGLLKDYLNTRGERDEVVSQFNSEFNDLESKMRSRDKALQRAMKRLEVKIHPKIHEITALICQAEAAELPPGAPDTKRDDIPDVTPYLNHLAYRRVLPAKYARFLASNQLPGTT